MNISVVLEVFLLLKMAISILNLKLWRNICTLDASYSGMVVRVLVNLIMNPI